MNALEHARNSNVAQAVHVLGLSIVTIGGFYLSPIGGFYLAPNVSLPGASHLAIAFASTHQTQGLVGVDVEAPVIQTPACVRRSPPKVTAS